MSAMLAGFSFSVPSESVLGAPKTSQMDGQYCGKYLHYFEENMILFLNVTLFCLSGSFCLFDWLVGAVT